MKRFFQKNGIMMLAAVVVVAVGLCIASAVSNQTGFLQNAAGVVTYPFRAAGSAVTGWFQSIGERFQTVESLRKENEDLRKENAQLTEDLRQAKTDSEENQRLRDLNGLRQQRRDFTFEAAHVIERSTSNYQQIHQGEGNDAPKGVRLDKVPDGVALEQGNGHVHQGTQTVEHQHPHEVPAEGPHKGRKPPPDAPVKGFCIFFFVEGSHQAFPPSSTSARSSLRIWMS